MVSPRKNSLCLLSLVFIAVPVLLSDKVLRSYCLNDKNLTTCFMFYGLCLYRISLGIRVGNEVRKVVGMALMTSMLKFIPGHFCMIFNKNGTSIEVVAQSRVSELPRLRV